MRDRSRADNVNDARPFAAVSAEKSARRRARREGRAEKRGDAPEADPGQDPRIVKIDDASIAEIGRSTLAGASAMPPSSALRTSRTRPPPVATATIRSARSTRWSAVTARATRPGPTSTLRQPAAKTREADGPRRRHRLVSPATASRRRPGPGREPGAPRRAPLVRPPLRGFLPVRPGGTEWRSCCERAPNGDTTPVECGCHHLP